MAKIHGRLIVEIQTNGTVHMMFLNRLDNADESPFIVKNVNAAEVLLRTWGLMPDQVASLRAEMKRNKIAAVDINLDDEIAANFRSKSRSNY
jgi:hypothetical protein